MPGAGVEGVENNGPPPPETGVELVIFDTETGGLDPRAHRLRCVSFGANGKPAIVLWHPQDRDEIQARLTAEGEFVAHHICFDMAFLAAAGYELPPTERWLDTIVLAHLGGERLTLQLDKLIAKAVKAGQLPEDALAADKAVRKWLSLERRRATKEGRRRPEKGDVPEHLLEPYVRADVEHAGWVYQNYLPKLNGQSGIWRVERRLTPVLFEAEQLGIPIDVPRAKELVQELERSIAEAESEARRLAGGDCDLERKADLLEAFDRRGVNLSSFPRTEKKNEIQLKKHLLALLRDPFAQQLVR